MQTTLATRYAVTRDPKSDYPELAGLTDNIISDDPTDSTTYELYVWGSVAAELALNSSPSVVGYSEIGSIVADLDAIKDAIPPSAYAAWLKYNSFHGVDSSPALQLERMAKSMCDDYVINTIRTASGTTDITHDVIADLQAEAAAK